MRSAQADVACSLIMNTSPADAQLVGHVLPHLVRTHKLSFHEIIVIVDESTPTGRVAQSSAQSLSELRQALRVIRGSGIQFKEVLLDTSASARRAIFGKWFGSDDVALRCASGTPIYAFLFGIEQASAPFRLHVDSDMLFFDPGPVSWVARATDILATHPEVAFVTQMMGPANLDRLDHEYLAPMNKAYGLRLAQNFSTRCFLYNDPKLTSQLLPIKPLRYSFPRSLYYAWTRGCSVKPLEQMIAHGLQKRGLYRCDLDSECGFTLHGWNKKFFAESGIERVISDIEAGRIPSSQRGAINLLHVWDHGV
jgi:hypothetical protein